jgi:hypothetical protein
MAGVTSCSKEPTGEFTISVTPDLDEARSRGDLTTNSFVVINKTVDEDPLRVGGNGACEECAGPLRSDFAALPYSARSPQASHTDSDMLLVSETATRLAPADKIARQSQST